MALLCVIYGIIMRYLWHYFALSMALLCVIYGIIMRYLWHYFALSMALFCVIYGFIVRYLWHYYALSMALFCVIYGIIMRYLWHYYALSMALLCVIYGIIMRYLWHYFALALNLACCCCLCRKTFLPAKQNQELYAFHYDSRAVSIQGLSLICIDSDSARSVNYGSVIIVCNVEVAISPCMQVRDGDESGFMGPMRPQTLCYPGPHHGPVYAKMKVVVKWRDNKCINIQSLVEIMLL